MHASSGTTTVVTTTAAMEEPILLQFDKEQCDVVFILEGETNTPFYCPSSFLNSISKEFQNIIMVKASDDSHYEIKAEGFGVDALRKALSFYQPMYFEYFNDSDDFKGILTVCSKFGLIDLKKKIQNYLMKKHKLIVESTSMNKQLFPFLQMAQDFGMDAMYDKIMGLKFESSFTVEIANSTNSDEAFIGIKDCLKYEIIEKCINTQIDKGLIEVHHFPLLKMAKELGNDAFYDKIMSLEVGFSFTNGVANNDAFAGMNDHLKYEIIKKCIKKDISECSKAKNTLSLEVISILHFLDLFFYENKILDYALHSKDIVASSTKKTDSLSLFQRKEINDVLVKVEGKELFVNSFVLSHNSPVFKAMLNSTFKEGLENVIELPGKRAEDIIELFTSLIHGKERTEYDAFRLLPLCQEYQIDWLQNLIQGELMKLNLPSDRLCLKYLNLSHNMGFIKGEEKFVNSLCESFIQLQRYKEFNYLKDETKLLVALRRLWYVYKYSCIQKSPSTSTTGFSFGTAFCYSPSCEEQSLSNLFDKILGLPSIFKNTKAVSFKMNTQEEKIIKCNQLLPPFSIEGQNC